MQKEYPQKPTTNILLTNLLNQDANTNHTISQSKLESLLKECELCTTDANHLEQMIWTTAGILFTASIAAISLLGGNTPSNPHSYDYIIRAIIALLSIIFVWFWYVLASRWYSIQKVMYYRIIEIEEELEMYKERYILYLDNALNLKNYPVDVKVDQMINSMRSNYTPGGVRKTVRRMSISLMTVWSVFFLIQLIAMVGVI